MILWHHVMLFYCGSGLCSLSVNRIFRRRLVFDSESPQLPTENMKHLVLQSGDRSHGENLELRGVTVCSVGTIQSLDFILAATWDKCVCVCVYMRPTSPPQQRWGYDAAVIALTAFSCHNIKCLGSAGVQGVCVLEGGGGGQTGLSPRTKPPNRLSNLCLAAG